MIYLAKQIRFLVVHLPQTEENNFTAYIFIIENLLADSSYRAGHVCWLHGNSLYYGFLLPVGIMMLANIFFFATILYKVVWNKEKARILIGYVYDVFRLLWFANYCRADMQFLLHYVLTLSATWQSVTSRSFQIRLR